MYMPKKLDRSELIVLVQRLIDNAGSEDEIAEWIAQLKESVPHPAPSDLIYWSMTEPDAEEVVDAALAYRPPEESKRDD